VNITSNPDLCDSCWIDNPEVPPIARCSSDRSPEASDGASQQEREERASGDNGAAGTCGSYNPRPTLVLARSPSESMGPRSRTGQW
jgi:hypothetical protein